MLGFEPAYTTAEAFADFAARSVTGGRAERRSPPWRRLPTRPRRRLRRRRARG